MKHWIQLLKILNGIKTIEDIIIENQGLKMNQDLSIEFAKFILEDDEIWEKYTKYRSTSNAIFKHFLKTKNKNNNEIN